MYLTMALSSSTAERTFSVMKCVKTADSLINKMFSTIHRDVTNDLDLDTEKLADEFFSSGCERRIMLDSSLDTINLLQHACYIIYM